MTVTTDTIESDSPFKLNLDFTASDFTLFLSRAEDKFNSDNPGGLTSAQQDEAVSLLVCHQIARKKTDVGMNSENQGGYSYSRSTPGKTGFLLEYERILASSGSGNKPSFGVRRSDHKTSKAFRTCDLKLAQMDCGDNNLLEPTPQDPFS